MKKLMAMLCMLTCVLGLSACGSETVLSEAEQQKGEIAKTMATEFLVPYMTSFFDDARTEEYQAYNVHELEALAEDEFNYAIYIGANYYNLSYGFSSIDVEGSAILNGITSFNGNYASLGDVDLSQGFTATYEVSGDEITVIVPLTGTMKDKDGNIRKAEAEIIFSNDIFLTVKSCTLNLEQTVGDLIVKAASDTLMGMGTVFVVLIIISIIIWALGGVPKLVDKLSGKNKKEDMQAIKTDAVDNTIAQIIEKEEQEDVSDDSELIAVIAAAIAASEGAVSTDGFVVRSIRKRR